MAKGVWRVHLAAGVSLLALEVAAQTAPPQPLTELDAVTVDATRTSSTVQQVPGSVSVISRTQMDRQLVGNIRDLVRYEPGVSIGGNPNRTGLGNFSIRGIDGNRILLLIDGMRLPDFPQSTRGPGLYTRDTVDVETLKRVEIVRGPASALYGSDAIGGVVAFTTKDPGDYLAEVGKDWYLGGKVSGSSVDRSFVTTATSAGRAGAFEALGQVSYTNFHAPQPNDPGVTTNPQDGDGYSGLVKLVWSISPADQLTATIERRERTTETELLSDLGVASGVRTLASNAKDRTQRTRASLAYRRSESFFWADALSAKIYWQGMERSEERDQLRLPTGSTQYRYRVSDNRTDQDLVGGDLQLENRFAFAGVRNRLIYGADFVHTDTTRPRDQTELNQSTGVVTKSFAGETYPNKTFPDTTTLLWGLFVQDEVTWGGLTVMPGLRFDAYRMTPHPDRIYQTTNPNNFKPSEISETAFSPKLGLSYKFAEALTLFGQYAHGFRAPPYDDANLGFSNPLQGYEVLPNANLKPETVDGVELGVRGKFAPGSSYQLAGFFNKYKNFIDQVGIGTSSAGLLQYQARNISEVEIKGIEARIAWRVIEPLTLLGSFALAEGKNKSSGGTVNSVDPAKLVGGARFQLPDASWGAELAVTHVWKKDKTATANGYLPGDYTIADIYGFWDINPNVSVNIGIGNLFDARYFAWADVQGLTRTSTVLGRYAQPGRNVTAALSVRF